MTALERDESAPTSVRWLAREQRWRAAGDAAPAWPLTRERQVALVAAIAIGALLLCYVVVLQHAVDHAEQHRQADAEHLRALWLCKTMPSPGERTGCLLQLDVDSALAEHSSPPGPRALTATFDPHGTTP
jgi:hypothetical protein